MTDYTKLVEDLRGIEKTMYALGTTKISMDNVSISLAYDKGWGQTATDAAAAIEALQAELGKEGKRVEHLLARVNELEDEMPKRGEWVEDTTTYAGPGLSNYKCSLCGKICGTWRRGLEPSELPNWCGNCGADMRKMEVQDGQ